MIGTDTSQVGGCENLSKKSKKKNEGDIHNNNFFVREPSVPPFEGKKVKFITVRTTHKSQDKSFHILTSIFMKKTKLLSHETNMKTCK